MIARRVRACAVLVAGAGLAACATTGDPNQGGLFGWSPEKARARQEELRATADSTRAQAQTERERAAALQASERQASDNVNRLTLQLKSLESENDRLERDLNGLIETRKVRGDEADRLREMLRRSREVRTEQAKQAARRPAAAAPTEAQLSAIDAQNRLLHREVQLLLGR